MTSRWSMAAPVAPPVVMLLVALLVASGPVNAFRVLHQAELTDSGEPAVVDNEHSSAASAASDSVTGTVPGVHHARDSEQVMAADTLPDAVPGNTAPGQAATSGVIEDVVASPNGEPAAAPEVVLKEVVAPEAPSMPTEVLLNSAVQPTRGVCYFDASTQHMMFHRGTTLPATAPAGTSFCTINLRQPSLDTCGQSNVMVGTDRQCKCMGGNSWNPHNGACEPFTTTGGHAHTLFGPANTLVEVVSPTATVVTAAALDTSPKPFPKSFTNSGFADDRKMGSLGVAAQPGAAATIDSVSPTATTAATCVDQRSSSTCASWKSKGYCTLNSYTSDTLMYVATDLCPRTCGRCGECGI